MNRCKPLALLLPLLLLLAASCTCNRIPAEDLEFPEAACTMVYTISDTESVRILYHPTSDFHLYGEWIKNNRATPVYLHERTIHSTAGATGYKVYLEVFDPNEPEHICSQACTHTYCFDKGALNSTYFSGANGEQISFIYSEEARTTPDFSWISKPLLSFLEPGDGIYQEEHLQFWYNRTDGTGAWEVNGTTVPIQIEFHGVIPTCVSLSVYDVSNGQKKQILYTVGALTNENTFVATEIRSGNMFYAGTVSEIRITKTKKDPQQPDPSAETNDRQQAKAY